MGKLVYIKTGQAVTGGQSAPTSGRGLMHLDGTPVERKRGTQPAKAKETKAVTPSASPRPMENASTGNSRPNSRLLADVRTGGTTPPSLDNGRVGKVISGAAKSTGSAYANLGGVLAEGAGKLNTRIANQNAGDSLQSDHDAVKRYEKMLRDVKWANGKAMTAADVKQVQSYLSAAKRRIASHEGYTKAVERSDKAVADKAYQKADRLSQSSAADVAQAKEGLGPVGQFAVDLGVQGVQMAGDVAASAVIPGAGLALMTARSAGSSAQRARQAGANYNQQLAYGLGSGALSLGTEKISNVSKLFQKAFGRGLAEKAASKLISKFGENTAVQVMSDLAKRPAGRLALSMISEGGEEFLEDVVQPFLQRATYDPSARFDLSDALYDAAVGAAMGGIGAGVDVIRQRGSSQADAQPTQDARPEVREGIDTTTPANAAEGTQNAVPGVETAGRLTSTDNMLRYRSDIDKVFSGDYPSGKLLSVGDTPELLTRYGANPLPMTMTQDAAYKIAYPEGYMGGKHNLGMSVLKQLPYQIENPVAILKSNTQPNSIVLLTAWKDGDKSIIVPLHLDKQGAISVENRIASAYQTGHMQSYLGEADSNVLYTKNNEDVHQLLSNGVQFPKAMADDILAKNNISQAEAKSNRDILSEVLFGKKRANMDAMTPEQQNAIYQANEAGTVGMDATGKVFQIDPEQHIDRRRMETVGGRDVNAFQFDHPELHRYYQEAANALIADADLSLQQPMSRRYERTMEGNAVQQAAQTSPHLRQAMDETGLSRDAIIDAAQRIITDQGQENVAAAKRVELILDDMLSNGYTTMTGEQVGPNSGYLTAKQSILGAGETQARGHGLDGVDGFDGLGNADAGTVNTPFDTMQAKSEDFHPVNPNSAERVQNDQRRAPSEVPVVNPDTGRNVEKTVSTILNSPLTSPEMATVYENAIAGGAFDYDVVTDRSAVQQAQAKIARDGWREVANSFIAKAELGQRITKADTAEAISAYNLAVSEGDHKAAFELATAIADAAHDSAQMVQAMNLMNRLTPEGRLLTLRRLVDRMNDRAARQNRTPRQSTADSGDVEGARANGQQAPENSGTHDTQNNPGLDEQANADLNRAMQESLDAAQSLIREIYETLQHGNRRHRRSFQEIIDRFPQYRNLARYFSEIDNYIREERASGWVESLGRELAKNADQRANPNPVRERTVYETVSSDLNAFMRQYIDDRRQTRKPRTAAERLTDFFNNRKEYAQAWKTAQDTLRSQYANNRDMLDRLEEFINGTIGYNARGSDAVMMRAVADAALQEDVKLKELAIRRRYDLDALSTQIADRLIQQTEAKDSDSIIIRDAVKRYVQEQYERNPKNTQKYISNDIKAAMRDFQITLSEILTQNIKSKNELANRISNALMQEYKISPNGAEAISNDIAAQFSDMVQEASRKKIEQLFQGKPESVQKTAMQRFTEYANLGVFSTAYNEAATERLFGMQARIDPALAESYVNAETDAERAAAWDAITTSIADQIPSTFREKANFWRYTSMLTNPTTHIRNIMGNAIQMGARKIKNGVGTAIERAVIKDQSQRTKAVNVDKDLKAFAKGQYETDQNASMGSGKYSDATAAGIEREIQSKRKMFKGEDVLSRAVQGIGDLNSRALDYEDVIFNRAAYVDSFAQALQAKGVTAAEAHAGTRAADVEAARAYAIEEAQKATYRNTTALSEALSKRGRYDASDNIVERGISFVTDALLPFRKTPANILTTGLDYSPIGLGKGIKEAMFDVKSGKCTAADAVDSIASGLTGTGIFALGAYLAAEGLLHVRAGDDDKEEAFEKSMGGQDYAIQIGDKSYTLDWALPAAMPLFAGAATEKSYEKGGGTFVSLVDSLKNIGSVIWETSMLSALNDLISYWSYADDPGAYLISKAASSYAGQYIPTIGSKVASVFDDTVRKSYVEKGSGQVASDVNYFLQGAAKKVPGARNQLQPLVDMWGNEVSNGSAPERVFQSFFSPGFLKAQDNSPATQEIRRLAKATGESAVYPAAAEKSYTVRGETRTLTGEEYTRYAKAMGQTRKELVEAAVKLPAYKSMSNAEKADYIQNVYKYARETARQQVDPKYEPSAKWIENAKTSKRDIGVSTGEFLALYQKYGSEKMSGKAYEKVKQAHDAGLSPKEYFSMKDSADTNGNGTISKAEASAALAGQENRADLWDIICTTNAKNPYK